MLRQLAGENQPNGRLDLTARQRLFVILFHEPPGLTGELLEGVNDQRIENGDGLLCDRKFRVHLLRSSKKMAKGTRGKTTIHTPLIRALGGEGPGGVREQCKS